MNGRWATKSDFETFNIETISDGNPYVVRVRCWWSPRNFMVLDEELAKYPSVEQYLYNLANYRKPKEAK